MEITPTQRVMHELILSGADQRFWSSYSYLELIDLFSLYVDLFGKTFEGNLPVDWRERFASIRTHLAFEIAERDVQKVRMNREDYVDDEEDDEEWDDDDRDYDWEYGIDSDPSDNDNYMRDI